MQTQEMTLAGAASELTPADLRYLQQHGMLAERPAASGEGASDGGVSGGTVPQNEEESEKAPPKRRRRRARHDWPEVGTLLEAEYYGQAYTAEVVAAPRYRSGRAVRIASGPAEGKVSPSLSGAMLAATEAQREAAGLGRKGVSSGWEFWKAKEKA